MKLSNARVKLLQNAVLADLETAINDFFKAGGERLFIGVEWMAREYDTAPYTAMVLYTE